MLQRVVKVITKLEQEWKCVWRLDHHVLIVSAQVLVVDEETEKQVNDATAQVPGTVGLECSQYQTLESIVPQHAKSFLILWVIRKKRNKRVQYTCAEDRQAFFVLLSV